MNSMEEQEQKDKEDEEMVDGRKQEAEAETEEERLPEEIERLPEQEKLQLQEEAVEEVEDVQLLRNEAEKQSGSVGEVEEVAAVDDKGELELPKAEEVAEEEETAAEEVDNSKLQLLEKDDSLQLPKEEEQVQEDDFPLRAEEAAATGEEEEKLQEGGENSELEKEEDDDLELQKEAAVEAAVEADEEQLQEGADDIELEKEEEEGDENLQNQVEAEEEQLQEGGDDIELEKEDEDDVLKLQEAEVEAEAEEEQLHEGGEELELEREDDDEVEDEEEEDGAEIEEENGKEEDFNQQEEIQQQDNGSQPAGDTGLVGSEDAGGVDVHMEDADDDDSSQLAGHHSPHAANDADAGGGVSEEDTGGDANLEDVEAELEANVVDESKGKRKRGKIQANTRTTPPQRKKKEEEDVCFVCYDGGSLVLCDRRGCPKAYHPACIKRDESFFQSKSKWNCDWHICSSCQKASHYMCYTCAYSLCKACTKDADFVCVRGTKGICGACMKTIMLIENITPENTEKAQVDFDDKTSWEYLFRDYWIDLKAKLSITVDELTRAKNPRKGDEPAKSKNSAKGIGSSVAPKEVSSGELYQVDDEKDASVDNGGNMEANRSKRRKTRDQVKVLKKQKSLVREGSDVDEVTPLTEGPWATKELLEFVAHMKNGDTSVVSQFDVQALLVEYIKRNNLRDPRQKSQIICDSRLRNLFGQPRVGHFEMLKLLENHFLIKEKSPADDGTREGVSDAIDSDGEAAGSSDSRNDRRRKSRKKSKSHMNRNSEEYAAIDVHNISLVYLKRSLLENLLDDTEKFHEKVVGSFVRIRISGGDQKQNMYRLVPVIGTSKVDESYKVGSRKTDIMVEILNLNKKETVSIDGISNQEFSEDECRRLRQSIKCGLIKRMKVGEVQEKAMALQSVKVNDWLQAEIARLNHLRDRASETGRRKELRECVEKLDLLKSPKERQRRLHEIPDVHMDPNMDPSHESEEDAGDSDDTKQVDHVRPRGTGFGRRPLDRNSSFREGDQNSPGNRSQKNMATASEQSRHITTPPSVNRESKWSQGWGPSGLNNHNGAKSQLSPTGVSTSDWSTRPAVRTESHPVAAPIAIPSPHSSAREVLNSDFETEKIWHYRDPSGNNQGPFTIIQLRKWNAKGHFPAQFRVWKTNANQEEAILLSDILDGRFPRRL
ncbi:zinc finger CCCH domain-containing protein 19-like [Mercurialis annua]|uniref:zinc finger CCCH domain-containing protein 19-like n=1 Tax=Mercurialis annua TaxID=3986 RepID=UPI00215E7391|nr:zinc finger CCCH domain-containing protein 19-like [Mercurialis annua]